MHYNEHRNSRPALREVNDEAAVPAAGESRRQENIAGIMSTSIKKQMVIALIALLGAIASGGSAAAEQKFQKLSGAQIQARFAGMELTDESHWGEVFGPNGKLAIYSMGHKASGKWRVSKDQLCLDTGQEPGGGCYEVWVSGNHVELRDRTSSQPLEGVLQKPTDGR